ncbi:RNA methyltransferase [Actinomyces sp. B33]|uniref:TrmH family RNA methyltransferase n=1 Tax=Actinomyces sp. B33 TaxID=2942131 RepID=UPI00233FA86C|nr:RNA methyltransferase [Actinomyces sp. B33]MDC4233106.1 RNA methyltransferase [Actinomyces sp. B33]
MSLSAGRPPVLDNPHSDRVRRVAGLVGRSARSRSGLMLVEGPQAVREVVRHRREAVRDVYLTRSAADRHPRILREAREATRWVHEVSDGVAAAMSADAQGILAVVGLDAVKDAAAAPAPGSTIVLLAQGRDPGNVGTIIRTADAMGAAAVVAVSGTVDVRGPKVVRASAGSVFHLPIVPAASLDEAIALQRRWGSVVLGTSGGAGTESLSDLVRAAERGAGSPLEATHTWVLGNEARGLSEEEMALCDLLVAIPMTGEAESLNVASAAAMCLFASQHCALARG